MWPINITSDSIRLAPAKFGIALAVGATATAFGAWLTPTAPVLLTALLAFALSWASVVDADRFILPDIIVLPLGAIGIVFADAAGAGLPERIIGALGGYTFCSGVALIYRRLRKVDGLGLGDAKLFGAGGAWLGWTVLPYVLLLASGAALIFVLVSGRGSRTLLRSRVAFGPFLAAGIWAVWLYQVGISP